MRCTTSGRFTPAAITRISTSPGRSFGTGRIVELQYIRRSGPRDLDGPHALGHGDVVLSLMRHYVSPSRRMAFSFMISGRTSGLMLRASKSAIQRSGVSAG